LRKAVCFLGAAIAVLALVAVPAFADPVGSSPPVGLGQVGGGNSVGTDPTFDIQIYNSDETQVLATGTVSGTELTGAPGVYLLTSGNLTVTDASLGGPQSYTLFAGPFSVSQPPAQIATSPSGAFYYDNVFFSPPTANGTAQYVDSVAGLLFVNSSGGEANIWGNGSSTAWGGTPGAYSFWTASATGSYGITNGDVQIVDSLAVVPEPAGLVALLGIGSMGLIGLVWRRK
jgi:hypothetical protein